MGQIIRFAQSRGFEPEMIHRYLPEVIKWAFTSSFAFQILKNWKGKRYKPKSSYLYTPTIIFNLNDF
jgi:hypothetical protein